MCMYLWSCTLHTYLIAFQVYSDHTDVDGYLKDYCDGENFKSHPLFSVHSRALQIFLYYDDLEICNPLGSKRGVHKIGKT